MNADDFGASAETVAATIGCLEQGAVTSATIMATMPAAEQALAYARGRPDLSFGVHLTFVGDGEERPAADPGEVPALVDGTGRFPRTRLVRLRALARRLPVGQIERELAAQIGLVAAAGVPVSHVDSHRHLHKLAPFRAALRRVLPGFGIERVRTVQDVYLGRPLLAATYWVGPLWRRPLRRSFRTTDHFYMPASTGDLGWADELLGRVGDLPGGTLEVGVHPGPEGWRADERRSAVRLAASARALGHELVSWREV
ncbi:MAG TPA: ChbG/HpnK family deacetylase [Gaiellaceae bacterium]|nr:ChbG/HpnK family deacetylase [Gaiellaceae bacterium]